MLTNSSTFLKPSDSSEIEGHCLPCLLFVLTPFLPVPPRANDNRGLRMVLPVSSTTSGASHTWMHLIQPPCGQTLLLSPPYKAKPESQRTNLPKVTQLMSAKVAPTVNLACQSEGAWSDYFFFFSLQMNQGFPHSQSYHCLDRQICSGYEQMTYKLTPRTGSRKNWAFPTLSHGVFCWIWR